MKLRCENLVKKYGVRTVVKGVSMEVNQGEIVGFLGPNGAGKTTSFYMITGQIVPNEGRVFLDDERALNHSPLAHDGADLSTLDSGAAAASSPSRESSTAGLSMDLDQALSTLSETERTCVVLQCVEGQSIKEIAQIMGIPENTVKSHLLRGKKNLANYLRSNGYG